MEIVYLLLPLALILVVVAAIGFIWAVKHGQFDDLKTPSFRALLDDKDELEKPKKKIE